MRVAITGASGFVGSYVLAELQKRDLDIVDLRRDPTARPAPHVRTSRVRMTLADAQGAFDAMGRPDLLIHLAWEGLPDYQNTRHVETEFPAHRRFLSGCINDGLKRLAVAGTCFEYGLREGELTEEMVPMPVTQYGLAKQALHDSLSALAASGSADLMWARFFYLYGPGQAATSLYSQLMHTIDAGLPFFDMSPGEQLRDYLPVAEAAELFVDVALSPGSHGTVNVCSGVPTTVSLLVERWVAERNARVVLNKGHFPYSAIEPFAFWGSRSKLNAIISKP